MPILPSGPAQPPELGHTSDDQLYRDLVRSLYSTPKSICAASAVAAAIISIAYHLSQDPNFLIFLLAFSAVGAARVRTVASFRQLDYQKLSPVQLRRWERYALAGAWSFSALTGISASYSTIAHTETEIELLTSCCAIGYIAGISSRNASRPLIAIGQITAICVPFLASLLYRLDVVHISIALFIICLFLSTIVMAKSIHENIVMRYRANADLQKAAHYDALTGLKNRTSFIQKINKDLTESADRYEQLALIAIDMDNFKDINDGLGHLAGDVVLKEVARRISRAIEIPHEVARIGGDEFLVSVRSVDLQKAKQIATQICDILSSDVQYGDNVINCSASVGIALGPRDGGTYNELMTSADLALYAAKAKGRRQVVEYCGELRSAFDRRRELERDMHSVLAHSEMELVFQPVVDARTKQAVSCEALLRWNHPTLGSVSPAAFIPIAEATGLIVPIGAWVLRTACAEALKWPSDVTVAVNISAVQLKRGHEFVKMVRDTLESSGLAPSRLELEITESVLIENAEATLDIVEELRSEGVGVALDDFGTGFSSLSYLKDFPFSKVKIDRKFSSSICKSAKARGIVKSILQLTADLGMELVAEGIETSDQLECMNTLGLRLVQGYIFSRPLSSSHLRAVLNQPFPTRPARADSKNITTARSAA